MIWGKILHLSHMRPTLIFLVSQSKSQTDNWFLAINAQQYPDYSAAGLTRIASFNISLCQLMLYNSSTLVCNTMLAFIFPELITAAQHKVKQKPKELQHIKIKSVFISYVNAVLSKGQKKHFSWIQNRQLIMSSYTVLLLVSRDKPGALISEFI